MPRRGLKYEVKRPKGPSTSYRYLTMVIGALKDSFFRFRLNGGSRKIQNSPHKKTGLVMVTRRHGDGIEDFYNGHNNVDGEQF